MKSADFDRLLEKRIQLTKEVLASKNKEYASDGEDRLHNFKRAANMLGCTPEKALVGMWTKHIISILDMVDDIEKRNKKFTGLCVFVTNFREKRRFKKLVEEKIGDAVNYLILLEALIKERYKL